MSVEKLDSAKVKQEKIPFTIHLNYVLQNVRNPLALAIWVYLTSLPDDWIVHRNQLMSHFDIGRDKLTAALKFLNQNYLIEYVISKNEKGQIENWQITVKTGHEFEVIHRSQSTPLNIQSLENHSRGKQHLQKKQNTNEVVVTKKSSCANDLKSKNDWREENGKMHSFAESKNQMANEARHIEEHETIKRAPMPDNLRSMIKSIKCSH